MEINYAWKKHCTTGVDILKGGKFATCGVTQQDTWHIENRGMLYKWNYANKLRGQVVVGSSGMDRSGQN